MSRFLYALLICMDANFRLKNHLVSNFLTDPGLWNGMAYMTPRIPYEEYVLSQADADDVSIHVYLYSAFSNTYFSKDQYMCRIPSPCKGDDAKHARASIYWD